MKLQIYLLFYVRLNVFENKMLRRIFEPKGMDIRRGRG
jgi:hypothetical protein